MRIHDHVQVPLALVLLAIVAALLAFFSNGFAVSEQAYVLSSDRGMPFGWAGDSCESEGRVSDVSGDAEATLGRQIFTVLSWNVHKGNDPDWYDDLTVLAGNADFLLLQEVVLNESFKQRLGVLGRQWLLAPAFLLGRDQVGVLSAARVRPRNYCAIRGNEPLIGIPKMALASTYPIAGSDETLLVVNVHVVNFTLTLESVRRQIEKITAMILSHQGPVIVAGDFNTWSAERVALIRHEMMGLGLQPVSFVPDQRTEFFNHTVDAIFFRGLAVLSTSTPQVRTSDHNPLQVRFRISGSFRG